MPQNRPSKPVPSIEDWLVSMPAVADAIRFTDHQGNRPFPEWSDQRRQTLQSLFQATWLDEVEQPLLADPPPNANPRELQDDDYPATALGSDDAWKLYAQHVAHSLVFEVSGALPWSVDTCSASSLRILFDSEEMFGFRDGLYWIDEETAGRATPAPPRVSSLFLQPLLGKTQISTISNLLDWCTSNFEHPRGSYSALTCQTYWRYRGHPPVSRILERSVHAEVLPEARNWTAGCFGTMGFLRAVLRAVNLPVSQFVVPCRQGSTMVPHSLPTFPEVGRSMSHGDDPYDRDWRQLHLSDPANNPGSKLLLDEDEFDRWFGPGVSPEMKCQNVGGKPAELSLHA